MKTIIPAADRTAGRRGAGRRRTKRFAANPQFHPQQVQFNREQVAQLIFVAELMGLAAERIHSMRTLVVHAGRKAFVR